jgi:hypothetical protein
MSSSHVLVLAALAASAFAGDANTSGESKPTSDRDRVNTFSKQFADKSPTQLSANCNAVVGSKFANCKSACSASGSEDAAQVTAKLDSVIKCVVDESQKEVRSATDKNAADAAKQTLKDALLAKIANSGKTADKDVVESKEDANKRCDDRETKFAGLKKDIDDAVKKLADTKSTAAERENAAKVIKDSAADPDKFHIKNVLKNKRKDIVQDQIKKTHDKEGKDVKVRVICAKVKIDSDKVGTLRTKTKEINGDSVVENSDDINLNANDGSDGSDDQIDGKRISVAKPKCRAKPKPKCTPKVPDVKPPVPGGDVKPPAGDSKPPAGDVKPPSGDVKPPPPPSGDVKPPPPPSGDVKPPQPPSGDVKPPPPPSGDEKPPQPPSGDVKPPPPPSGDVKPPQPPSGEPKPPQPPTGDLPPSGEPKPPGDVKAPAPAPAPAPGSPDGDFKPAPIPVKPPTHDGGAPTGEKAPADGTSGTSGSGEPKPAPGSGDQKPAPGSGTGSGEPSKPTGGSDTKPDEKTEHDDEDTEDCEEEADSKGDGDEKKPGSLKKRHDDADAESEDCEGEEDTEKTDSKDDDEDKDDDEKADHESDVAPPKPSAPKTKRQAAKVSCEMFVPTTAGNADLTNVQIAALLGDMDASVETLDVVGEEDLAIATPVIVTSAKDTPVTGATSATRVVGAAAAMVAAIAALMV